jgi:hypothetical protein
VFVTFQDNKFIYLKKRKLYVKTAVRFYCCWWYQIAIIACLRGKWYQVVMMAEGVRTLRERARILYYAHFSHLVYQCTRSNSLPSVRPCGAKSLLLFLSSSDSRLFLTVVLLVRCPVPTRCHMCLYHSYVLHVGLLLNTSCCRLVLMKSDAWDLCGLCVCHRIIL